MRFVGFSDVHRDAVTHGVERAEEVDRAVEVIASDVREGDCVVFGGDLGDPGTNRIYATISKAIEWDRDFRARGARHVFWMVGNHDVLEDGSGGSVLLPLAAAGAKVVADAAISSLIVGGGKDRVDAIFLPHAPLVRRYDPGEFLEKWLSPEIPTIVFGHLNPPGISPGSEATLMPRGRDVMWPKITPNVKHLFVGGHIHRAQEWPARSVSLSGVGYDRPWGSVQIIGSPLRFDFGEKYHVPSTFVAEWKGKDWYVERRAIGDRTKLRTFVDLSETSGREVVDADTFVRGVMNEETKLLTTSTGATFVALPPLAEGVPKADVSEGAKKHRRVRDVVTDIAAGYPTAKKGLLDTVENLLGEIGL